MTEIETRRKSRDDVRCGERRNEDEIDQNEEMDSFVRRLSFFSSSHRESSNSKMTKNTSTISKADRHPSLLDEKEFLVEDFLSALSMISDENLLKSEAFHELIPTCLSIGFYFLTNLSLSQSNDHTIEIEIRWISIAIAFECLQWFVSHSKNRQTR